jgi:hypothetical protein
MADRRPVRVVLGVGVAIGLFALAGLAVRKPSWVGVDYRVYELAARAALAGEPFYDVPPAGFGFTYVYPPASVLVFAPLAVLPGWAGFALFTLTELLAAAGVAWCAVALAVECGGTPARRDRFLLVGFAALSGAAVTNLFYAQVNHHLALAVGVGLVAVERRRGGLAGVALAVPAYVKAFPAAIGAWLLARRSWRGVAAAVGTGLGLYGLGVALFGTDALGRYVDAALLARLSTDTYSGAMPATAGYVTLRRPVSVLAPGLDTLGTTLVVLAVLVPVLGVLYADLTTPRSRLLAAHGTVVAVLLAVPSYPTYLLFAYPTLLAALYVLEGRPRQLALVGTALVAVPFGYGTVGRVLAAAPPAIGGPAAAVLEPAFTVATPALWGLLSTLAAALLASQR